MKNFLLQPPRNFFPTGFAWNRKYAGSKIFLPTTNFLEFSPFLISLLYIRAIFRLNRLFFISKYQQNENCRKFYMLKHFSYEKSGSDKQIDEDYSELNWISTPHINFIFPAFRTYFGKMDGTFLPSTAICIQIHMSTFIYSNCFWPIVSVPDTLWSFVVSPQNAKLFLHSAGHWATETKSNWLWKENKMKAKARTFSFFEKRFFPRILGICFERKTN